MQTTMNHIMVNTAWNHQPCILCETNKTLNKISMSKQHEKIVKQKLMTFIFFLDFHHYTVCISNFFGGTCLKWKETLLLGDILHIYQYLIINLKLPFP